MWRCEYYATLTLWRIFCECKTFRFAAYSPEMIRLPRRITEKVRPFKWLRMLPNFLRIPANFLRSLRSVCRISCESFANVKTIYECLTITTNALPSMRIYCDAYDNNKNCIRKPIRHAFATGETRITFETPQKRPRMLTNSYECLAIICDHYEFMANCIRKPIRHIFATV